MQTIATVEFIGYLRRVTYGERFQQIRLKRWHGTVLELAAKIGKPYPATVYNIEKRWRVPKLETIGEHAAALNCQPWELLLNVETEYDEARALNSMHPHRAAKEWADLLERYKDSVSRTKGRKRGHASPKRHEKRGTHGGGGAGNVAANDRSPRSVASENAASGREAVPPAPTEAGAFCRACDPPQRLFPLLENL